MLEYAKNIFFKKNVYPIYLTYFVTSRCNLQCQHCFYWDSLNKIKNELNLEEIEKFSKELKEIIEAFSKIDKVDTKGVETSLQAVELRNVLREDKVEKSFTSEEALNLTEHKKDGYFKGPRAV